MNLGESGIDQTLRKEMVSLKNQFSFILMGSNVETTYQKQLMQNPRDGKRNTHEYIGNFWEDSDTRLILGKASIQKSYWCD